MGENLLEMKNIANFASGARITLQDKDSRSFFGFSPHGLARAAVVAEEDRSGSLNHDAAHAESEASSKRAPLGLSMGNLIDSAAEATSARWTLHFSREEDREAVLVFGADTKSCDRVTVLIASRTSETGVEIGACMDAQAPTLAQDVRGVGPAPAHTIRRQTFLRRDNAHEQTKCAGFSISEYHSKIHTGFMGRSEMTGLRLVSINRLLTLGVLAVLFVIFSVFSNNFFTVRGVLNLLVQTSTLTITAVGSALVLIVGGIDFSLGAVVAFGGVGVTFFAAFGAPVWLAMAGGVGLGGLIGLANGFLVTRLRMPSFLATTSVAMILYGIMSLLAWIAFNSPPPPHTPDLGGLANTPVFRIYSTDASGARVIVFPGISWLIIIMVIVAVLIHFFLVKTRIGRYFRLVGFNQEAARFSGIKVNRVKRLAYVLGGMLAALSGVLLTSRLGMPSGGAAGYEMSGIMCAMIGGASLNGGEGSIGGTVIGSFIIGTLAVGLSMANTNNPALPMLFNGVVILAAVFMDQARSRRFTDRGRKSGPDA
jgi:ribose transport system permease protein